MLEALPEVFMYTALLLETTTLLKRRGESDGGGGLGCFILLIVIGVVIYFVMKGRRDRSEQLGATTRPMSSGPLQPHTFANPFPKCPNCGAAGDKMKQQWDGLRKVTWTCGYCSNAQVQDLQDHELPPAARQRLGLDPQPGFQQGPGVYPQQGGGGFGGVGGLLTGMMIGNMLGGSGHHHRDDGGSDWSSGSDSSSGSDWGDSGGDSGGDWGDSGGGDSGGSDW